jgi:hypothetical protein
MLVGREKTPLARPAVNGGLIRRGLVVALLGSCLSPPAVATAASPSLTIAAYRAQASAICKTANRELNHHSPANFAGEVEFAFETVRSAYAALARLKPPPRLAPLHAKMLVNTRALLADFPPLVKAAKIRNGGVRARVCQRGRAPHQTWERGRRALDEARRSRLQPMSAIRPGVRGSGSRCDITSRSGCRICWFFPQPESRDRVPMRVVPARRVRGTVRNLAQATAPPPGASMERLCDVR